jgi:HTH-type transcriptional regulator/antitoxin HipB
MRIFPIRNKIKVFPSRNKKELMNKNNIEFELRAQNKEQLLKAIQRFRKNMNLTQTELSQKAGLPQSSVSKLESASREPTLTLIFKILSALGLEIVLRKKRKISKTDGIVI